MCIVLFLTSNFVLMSTVGKNRVQLCETPGLHTANKASQEVQIIGFTEDKKQTQHRLVFVLTLSSIRPTLKGLQLAYIKCVTSPLVCVAEIRPEFRHTVQVNTLWSTIKELTPSAIIRQ